MKIIFPTRGRNERYPKGHIIQGYGENPQLYNSIDMKFHNGWDIVPVTGYGEDILAPHSGEITVFAYEGQGYGNRVDIASAEENGIMIVSTLGHLTEQKLVMKGQSVIAGQVVGKMGNSGFTVSGGVRHWGQSNPDNRGTHLHWTVKRYKRRDEGGVELYQYFGKKYELLNIDNGVRGAIDPGILLNNQRNENMFPAIKRKSSATVYLQAGRTAFPFTSAEAFAHAGGEFEEVQELDDAEFYKLDVREESPVGRR